MITLFLKNPIVLIPAITLNTRHVWKEGWEVLLFKPKYINSSIWCLPLKTSLLIKTWTRAMHLVLSLTSAVAVAVSAEHSGDHLAHCTLTNYAFHRVRGLPAWLYQQLLSFLGYPSEHWGSPGTIHWHITHCIGWEDCLCYCVSYIDTLHELVNFYRV